jgi:hypothetical protein
MNCKRIAIVVLGLGMCEIPAAAEAPASDAEKVTASSSETAASSDSVATQAESAPAPQTAPAPQPAPAPQAAPTPQPSAPKSRFLKEPQSTMFGKFKFTPLNFIEFDAFYDTTQSFQDTWAGNTPIARSVADNNSQEGTYAGRNGRTNFTARNTQLGLQIEAPEVSGMTALGHCRIDFHGQQPGTPQRGTSENSFQNSATARLFHCYGVLKTPYVDVLGGLTYSIFGNQPYFFPASLSFLAIPGEVFSRTTQLRLSHEFETRHVNTLLQAALARPPQRNAELPDILAAARLMFNDWKGVRTIGATGTKVDSLAFGVSGAIRQFKVQEYVARPIQANKIRGLGFSADAFVPIIPANSLSDAGNSLSLTGSFAWGTGIADMWAGITGGWDADKLKLPLAPGEMDSDAKQIDIDPGLAIYDEPDHLLLHTITWRSFNIGLQYYLPGPGNVWIYGNYNQIQSPNLEDLVWAALVRKPTQVSSVFTKERFMASGIFWAIVPNFQVAIEYANLRQWFIRYDPKRDPDKSEQALADKNGHETNHRFSLATYYVF